ncbi:DHA2 family efflux MFS transporter permease subunit [Thalassospira profundimaris]|uniref:DHA2 family efflux MFS transporter permease subunit n=1 Tax=Thalassospira profundimaris TaxID=502049 RepID=UPI000287227F|nr:DHA2 family efflux MFS transporter permease subunit [Thalassospira profundimaris]EKF08458.1 multidrug resistance efflux pump (EmrB-like) protein [Thalassospira profundimaris WP0211]
MATANPASPTQSETRPMETAQFVGWVAMVVGMFLAILDIQIVASSLENIQAGLSASPDEIGWVQTSYLIAEVVMIPLSGFLSRLMSTRWLFVISAIGFTVMSVASAFAWSIESMIWFRAMQGFLGGAMIPTVFATTYIIFPPDKRNAASVMTGLIATMAPTIGPTLGGFLTQSLSWHWLFLINVIPGLMIAAVVAMTLRVDRGDIGLLKGFDLRGLLSMAVFLGSLEYVLDEGPKDDWFDETAIIYGTITCALAGIYFFWRMFTYDKPIVDLKSFADRNFTMGCVFSFTLGVGLYGSVYLMPLMLGRVRGYDSLEIGIVMAVTGITQFLSAPIAGKMTAKYPPRVVLGIGLALFATGLAMHGFNTSEVSFNELIWPQVVRGAALMFCMLPVTNLALGTLPPEKIKNASGLYNLMRNLGGAIGMAAINTLLDKRIDYHFSILSDHINPASTAFKDYLATLTARFGEMGLADPHAAAMKFIVNIVNREASIISFNDVYLAMAAAFLIAFLLLPLAKPPRAEPGVDAAH